MQKEMDRQKLENIALRNRLAEREDTQGKSPEDSETPFE
jgi:hypothetical protein